MTFNTLDRSVLPGSLSKLADPEAVDAMIALATVMTVVVMIFR